MYTSETLTHAGVGWRAAADALVGEAQGIAPRQVGVFGDLGTVDEGEAASGRIDRDVTTLLREGDRALAELAPPAAESSDARFQATAVLVGTLAVGDALSAAEEAPATHLGGLSVANQAVTFADARATIAETAVVVAAPTTIARPADAAVPTELGVGLEKIETAGASETRAVLAGSVGKLAGGALVSGLDGVLKGTAAAAFDAIRSQLSTWRDVLKRGVVRIATWVVERLKAILPAAAAEKVDELVEAIQERITAGIGELATDVYGRILGRNDAEQAWRVAQSQGRDLAGAVDQLAEQTSTHTDRIAWVTRARTVIERFDVIAAALVAQLAPQLRIAFAALVAAVVGFVAFQVWDGFNDIEALV